MLFGFLFNEKLMLQKACSRGMGVPSLNTFMAYQTYLIYNM